MYSHASANGTSYGEYSCEIILNLDQWFRRCRLKKKFKDSKRTSKIFCITDFTVQTFPMQHDHYLT